jgi:hypothetical protein
MRTLTPDSENPLSPAASLIVIARRLAVVTPRQAAPAPAGRRQYRRRLPDRGRAVGDRFILGIGSLKGSRGRSRSRSARQASTRLRAGDRDERRGRAIPAGAPRPMTFSRPSTAGSPRASARST